MNFILSGLRKLFKNKYSYFFKYFFLKRENINDFRKGNKMKGGNKDALLSGRDRHIAKNYITT